MLRSNHQEIVPVKLQDGGPKYQRTDTKAAPQKLVARLKRRDAELFIYEEINDGTLKVLLTEMSSHEDR